MYVVSSQEMREIDSFTIETLGLSAELLMENAGRVVAQVITKRFPVGRHVLILAGKGNNGGDGMVTARHLVEAGYPVQLILADSETSLSPDASVQYERIKRFRIPVQVYDGENFETQLQKADVLVDALLGTGTKGSPREPYASMIAAMNRAKKPIVSVDIPSGIDADNGSVFQPCIRATLTVALAFLKRGLVGQPGAEYAGECVVEPIGIPGWAAEQQGVKTFLLTEREIAGIMKSRNPSGHKGSYGHVIIIGSSQRMIGAGLLAAQAALRTGAGLVTLGLPSSLLTSVGGRVPEVMLAPIPDHGLGDYSAGMAQEILLAAEGKHVLAIGPGLGRFADGEGFMKEILRGWKKPLILDADALNLLAPDVSLLKEREYPTILTPHPGEMARLLACNIAEVQRDRIQIAKTFATTFGVTLVLKGSYTVIADHTGHVAINPTGNPGMATGGTGDVLTGMVSSLVSQGYSPFDAARIAVFIHGAAGDRVAKRVGVQALAAGDIIQEIGPAWLEIESNRFF